MLKKGEVKMIHQMIKEVHHKKQLSEGGEDSVENAIAICPNYHREMHFGI